jgi:hypothetical protein
LSYLVILKQKVKFQTITSEQIIIHIRSDLPSATAP